MKESLLATSLVIILLLVSCTESTKTNNIDAVKTDNADLKSGDEIITSSTTNKEGKTLDMVFNNTKNSVTLIFKGEKIELIDNRAGSGMWYKNDHYELRGKGEELELTKDGKVIFKN